MDPQLPALPGLGHLYSLQRRAPATAQCARSGSTPRHPLWAALPGDRALWLYVAVLRPLYPCWSLRTRPIPGILESGRRRWEGVVVPYGGWTADGMGPACRKDLLRTASHRASILSLHREDLSGSRIACAHAETPGRILKCSLPDFSTAPLPTRQELVLGSNRWYNQRAPSEFWTKPGKDFPSSYWRG
jgi:hypothetical protein